ncbi:MAG TPA: selenide, water dikinase SelD, partial [Aggregatilineales bacterium]|nr:selenide, water dikinase SelD [Aggregatilineales bacterium]
VLRPLNDIFTPGDYPDLLIGLNEPDDSAVYRISPEVAIISTTDFFPPVVDDPYDFGAIAAANALSDIYAMGGEPIMAINLVAYPDGYGYDLLTEILRGGAEKVRESGAVIAGGHTVTDKEPKYGLSVTGRIHPDRILTKGGARPGDALILSKPLGSGVITTALKNDRADAAHVAAAVAVMKRLNRSAAQAAVAAGVHALTDITGYGLLGHGHEMAHLSGVTLRLHFDALHWIPGARAYADQDIFAGGMRRNQQFYAPWVTLSAALTEAQRGLLYDPQTSGGLLMAVPAEGAPALLASLTAAGDDARIIGEVVAGEAGRIDVVA